MARYLDTIRLWNPGGLIITLAAEPLAYPAVLISPKIPFRYCLDQLHFAFGNQAVLERFGLEIFISDDDDPTGGVVLSGERLWTSSLNNAGGDPAIPMFDYSSPFHWEPAKIVRRAPTFLKAVVALGVGNLAYSLWAHVTPLPADF